MRVAIVNDLPLHQEILRRIVVGQPGMEIAWSALEGAAAVERCRHDRPDVILMDLLMPVMNGVEATRRIMQSSPCPILLVTSTVAGNFALVCEALGAGAFDAVQTPAADASGHIDASAILLKLSQVERIQRRLGSAAATQLPTAAGPRPTASASRGNCPLLLIGASTGGPPAIRRILQEVPADFPAAVVIAQHIGTAFISSLIEWLQTGLDLPIQAAKVGDKPAPGRVYLAASEDHLILQSGTLNYTPFPKENPFRPSVDVLFGSAANMGQPGVAVLLTGIGRDGAKGMLALKGRGWHTIAEDHSTCVVYGMPQAAAELNAAKQILPLPMIATAAREAMNLLTKNTDPRS